MRRAASVAALFSLLLVAACGGGGERPELDVFAASSLEPVLSRWAPEIEERLGVELSLSFASSTVVARQVVEGAPADVLITADRRSMQIAADAGVVDDRRPVARNRLALVVRASNPVRIRSVRDLQRSDVKLVLCDPDVPCGRLAANLIERVGLSVRPVSFEENVSAAIGKVALGEADATIAYASDLRAGRADIEGVAMPEADDPELEAVYPAAVVRRTTHRAAAESLIELLTSSRGRAVFGRAGFLAP
ncbi:MAG TPA: molybdate ABC transporter substrate-binding protein [Acidimicrobiales bacterium]|nr:molybdate ABC transporter substrate-binding protein [Acidimicrobiales bacterium]